MFIGVLKTKVNNVILKSSPRLSLEWKSPRHATTTTLTSSLETPTSFWSSSLRPTSPSRFGRQRRRRPSSKVTPTAKRWSSPSSFWSPWSTLTSRLVLPIRTTSGQKFRLPTINRLWKRLRLIEASQSLKARSLTLGSKVWRWYIKTFWKAGHTLPV